MGYLIGADIGSQSVKAVLLDPGGRTVASAGQACAMLHPANGWAEQDPADWQTGLTIAVRQLITRSGVAPSQVTHLGLASQVDGVVPVDGRLGPLRPPGSACPRPLRTGGSPPGGQDRCRPP